MFHSYLKIAWRNLLKHKLFSFVNVIGLGLGMPFALISLLTVQNAYESDNFHPFPDCTYRLITYATPEHGTQLKYATSPFILSDKIKESYPFITEATKTVWPGDWELTNQIKSISVSTLMVEPQFFNMFNFELSQGSIPVQPNSMVMTSDMAKTFFGEADPVGKVLTHNTYGDLIITGVLKPYKSNTQFRSDVMVSMATLEKSSSYTALSTTWTNYQAAYTYVLLNDKSNSTALSKALVFLSEKANSLTLPGQEALEFHMQSLREISPDFLSLINNRNIMSWTGDLAVVFLLAILILVLAGFNYVNLTLAKSLNRAKEVGVRKVAGATRVQVLSQFLVEAIFISVLSLIIGLVGLSLIKDYVHVKWINWDVDQPYLLLIFFLLFAILLGIMAGIIPAQYLSRFQPAGVMKSNNPGSYGRVGIRSVLIVIQFAVSLIFMFTIGHMYNQFNYMANDNINFNRNDILNISIKGQFSQTMINDFVQNHQVQSIGLTSSLFGYSATQCQFREAVQSPSLAAFYYAANGEFVDNMRLTLLAGANLSMNQSDKVVDQILINEQGVYALGYQSPGEVLGKIIVLNEHQSVTIQGVVKNFCYGDYRSSNSPIIMQYNPALFRVMSVLLKPSYSKNSVISSLSTIWKQYQPYQDFSYSWYKNELNELYSPGSELKFQSLISGIILVIAILGLFGIVIYTLEKRLKEICIRKIVGASIQNIILELSWGFMKLLVLAILVAVPLGFMIGIKFTALYVYTSGINFGLMLAMVGVVLVISFGIIVLNSIKAAFANPIKSLRNE